jgi:hypothetical protein
VTEYALMIKLVDGTSSAYSFIPYAFFGHSWFYFEILWKLYHFKKKIENLEIFWNFGKFWDFDLFCILPRVSDYCASLRRWIPPVTLYWFPVASFRCKEFYPLVLWIWNQNIAISTIVGTSSHNMIIGVT